MKNKQDIEDIFQEAFESYSVKPDASVWANIQSQIPSASIGGSIGSAVGKASMLSKIIVGTALIGGIATSVYFFSRSQEKAANTTKSQSSQPLEQGKNNADPISINVEADSLEHLSKEVEKEKIKEIEEIFEKTKNETAKTDVKIQNNIKKENKMDVGTVVDEKSEKKLEESKEQFGDETEINNNKITEADQKENIQGKTEASSEAIVEDTAEKPIAKEAVTSNMEVEEEIHSIIPNIFTPNQDGINDVFRIESKDADDLEVAIFDKRGQKLFEWKGLYGFWDGRLPNGEMAPADNYFYHVILTKGDYSTVEKGSVLLKK